MSTSRGVSSIGVAQRAVCPSMKRSAAMPRRRHSTTLSGLMSNTAPAACATGWLPSK